MFRKTNARTGRIQRLQEGPPPGEEGFSRVTQRVRMAEDAFYVQRQVPDMFDFAGINPKGQDMARRAPVPARP